jgi:N-dimethylarginine dimethylaminohydrolase
MVMTKPLINSTVLMSGAEYFDDIYAINAYMDNRIPVNRSLAAHEHDAIQKTLEQAGVTVIKVSAPVACQDGVYTANWGLCRGDTVIMSRLPNKRKNEESYAEKVLRDLGKRIIKLPDEVRFSGQGDALPCGNLLFMGTSYRTDPQAHQLVADILGYEVISLQTIPKRSIFGLGPVAKNRVTGWPDSFFYDIDLALAVLRAPSKTKRGLIAWCPKAFTPSSQAKIRLLDIETIEVSRHEAQKRYACNLVSTGQSVIMTSHAPKLRHDLESHGFTVYTPQIQELIKGGGYIRCVSLTLDNV